ncbi:hypothetical protein H4R19_001900 [Coemansia spiralis]|nr:hypothetical protein H4R19_001900 [Coemansia spiralis]
MDGSRLPRRYSGDRDERLAWRMGDEFTTPEGPRSGFQLGSALLPSGTPASRIAAAAIGRRLDLGPSSFSLAHGAAAAPPGFSLGRLSPGASGSLNSSPQHSAFATPIPHQRGMLWDADQELGGGRDKWTPLGKQHAADGPPTPFGTQAVDEDFILNLNQEGDLERLTRKAVEEVRTAWKPLAMDALRKQVASLDDDEWMHGG